MEEVAELNHPDSGRMGEAMRGFMQGGDELFIGPAVAEVLPPVSYEHEEGAESHVAADCRERIRGRAGAGE